ncbi:MAG TPA: hypothetical protein VJC03_08020, partial [bacterium]|nr:hypothetical protein [bacterium]
KSWLRRNIQNLYPLQNLTPQPGEIRGPFNLGVIVTPEGRGRILLLGTSRIVESNFGEDPANTAFFLNIVDWLAQDEALMAIRSKGISYRPIRSVSDTARITIKYINLFLGPMLMILLGVFVWQKEKMKRQNLPFFWN